ncbi:hypothetical protein [Pedobacter antarcticus]|uniref:hypothetical protein n=1 Tax=Pedobacter antarcticus TaxID=34086 RepID=UPI00088D9A97|nr:hypothetical protein [Pedobacter antarcticus]SDM39966.1 hypothetical protein SAMN04488084_106151 [Pedobacter antarcticus]
MESNITFDQVSFNNWLDQLEEFLISIYWPSEEAAEQKSRDVWKPYFQNGITPVEAFMNDQSEDI